MTRHRAVAHNRATPRGSMETHVRFAGVPVPRHPNPAVVIVTGSPIWPDGYFLDALTTPRAGLSRPRALVT